jgi:hypothetical protein
MAGGGPLRLVTTNNVTYAEYTWPFGGCEDIVSMGPVVSDGSNFSYDFDLELESGVPCPMIAMIITTAANLGTLTPGDYTLTTTSWGVPVSINVFTIPTNSTTTLQATGFASDGSFDMQLTGATNVSFVLQSSSNCVNWTSLSTNSVGQPVKDAAPVVSGSCFYCVQILDSETVLASEW